LEADLLLDEMAFATPPMQWRRELSPIPARQLEPPVVILP
jgi:hypothetical protein